MMKILIMGLPGSGKTILAQALYDKLVRAKIKTHWYNGDRVRKNLDDWDFSDIGRLRQAKRMGEYGNQNKNQGYICICEFVCPTEKYRKAFEKGGKSDMVVWVDTIESSPFEDTNKIFESPKTVDIHVTTKDAEKWSNQIFAIIKTQFDANDKENRDNWEKNRVEFIKKNLGKSKGARI